jgi:Transaldolase/Fructose-6-phosphate aldolase
MTNPLLELKALGQSVWLDNIDRAQLLSGLFERLRDEDGITGATGNPTIFEHSITYDTTYDKQMQQLIALGVNAPLPWGPYLPQKTWSGRNRITFPYLFRLQRYRIIFVRKSLDKTRHPKKSAKSKQAGQLSLQQKRKGLR